MVEFDYTKEPGRWRLNRNIKCDDKPLVSIITPYYNAGKYFEQTFNCVMNQTFPWFEWIIVDDGSSEESSIDILKKFTGTDSRIKVIRQENGGQSVARNAGIRSSATDIIVPLDADDLIAPPFLEELYFALQKNPQAAWAYTDSVGFGAQEYLWKQPFSVMRMKEENILVCTAAIRKEWLEKVGGYEVGNRAYDEDWHLWLRLLAAGAEPIRLSGYLFWYRRSSDGMQQSVQKSRELREASKKMIQQAAQQVRTDCTGKEFPCSSAPGGYFSPKLSDWNRKVFQTHNKVHVMMLLPWMEMGGADLFNLDICRKIDKGRFEVSILTTVPGEQSWRQRFEEYVTDIFDLPSFLEPKDFPEFISYFIKSREIDVLFLSNSYDGYYLVPWLRAQFPELAIIDYVHMEEWYWRSGGYARTSGAMGEVLEKTYVCNERTRRVMIQDFGRKPESVETLYIGVDQEEYNAEKVESGLVRNELGIAADRPIVLFPCRIHPQKRPFLMLEIAKETKKSIPNVAFVVVGDGPQFEELKIAIEREGLQETVYLAGRQKDMRPYYKDATLTLICSLKEGLALTAYESLSMSTPVITSDVGGQAELIDSTVGKVLPLLQSESEELDSREFSQEEVRQYVGAITDILGDCAAYEKMCVACRKKIEDGFSSQIMIQKLEKIFKELVHDTEKIQQRKALAQKLGSFERLTSDYYTVYRLSESMQSEAEEVWKSREWFRELYEAATGQIPTPTDHKTVEETGEMLPDITLQMYRSGKIGFKYIIKYILAWAKYKLSGKRA